MQENKKCFRSESSCMFYILGLIGAAVYYISQADGFWIGVLGFLKAIIWPVFVVFEILKHTGM